MPKEEGDFRKPDLVEVIKLDPTIRLDIRYATTNNFVGRQVYPSARAFLQRPAAESLVKIHRRLKKKGFGLMIYDAYRPWSVVKLFWNVTPEKHRMFVADPANGSGHSRGCAVDLTLYDLKTGKAVAMPGEYDEWSERSHIRYEGGGAGTRETRDFLIRSMEAEGFIPCEREWWHFTHPDMDHYRNLDWTFEEADARQKP